MIVRYDEPWVYIGKRSLNIGLNGDNPKSTNRTKIDPAREPPNDIEPIESIPPDRSKRPPEGMAHFQAPTDPPEVILSKTRSAAYHSAIGVSFRYGGQSSGTRIGSGLA